MRNKILIILSMILIMVFAITICYADNPVVQTIYTADPAPLVYNNTVYLYTGHDEDNATGFLMKDYRCFSSTDMVNWTDHGAVLDVTKFSWAGQTQDANAAQVIYRNGKFYYYVSVAGPGGIAIGVGVSTSPTGPFTDARGSALITYAMTNFSGYATHGWRNLDPTVFIDDDGQAYMYWGNNALYYVKLNNDMISYSGSINYFPLTTAAFGDDYEEAPWLYKRNGLYYLAFASFIPERICYSTSTSPIGPWTYRGVIMNAQSDCAGNHPGIIDYKGNSYFFGFNRALLRMTSSENYERRSVCVDKFNYNANGTIPTLPVFSTSGPPQIENLNPYVQTEAETICWESGVETESCSEGGMDVCNIENGDYIKVKGVDFGTGAVSEATSFEARVASATSGGNIEIRLDSLTGTLVGTCAVQGTGGWQTWVTKTCTISGASGIHDLYFKFTGGSGFLFNFNRWKFSGGIVTTPTPTPTSTLTPTPGMRSAFSRIEAESFNTQSGIQSESCGEGGQNIGYIENGDYVVYNNIDFGTGATGFQARVASGTSGGNIEIRLDSTSGALVGTCSVAGTGGWQTWVTNTCNVNGASGTHNLYLRFTGGSGYLFNINWFQFTSGSGTPTPTPAVTPLPTATPTPTATPAPTPTPVNTYVRFRNVATGLYIDGMGSTANGSNACQYSSSSSTNQQWTIITSGSYVMIQNKATGLYLDGMGRTSNGSICGQWASSGSNNQQWTRETVGSYVKFRNRATGLYLDGMGSTANGSNLCQWSSSSSTNQQWQIQ